MYAKGILEKLCIKFVEKICLALYNIFVKMCKIIVYLG